MPITIAATGHRPDKLGGYSPAIDLLLHRLARDWLSVQLPTIGEGVDAVISGMALGWDTAIAQAALDLSIPLICAIPCPQQPSRWPTPSVQRWKAIKDRASAVHIISPTYTPGCMQLRNIWMVDHCTELVALWNGSPGGTSNCLTYAAQRGKPVTNLWNEWKEGFQCPSLNPACSP